MSIERALKAVEKATGYSLTREELQDLLDEYKSLSPKMIERRLKSLAKGEHGGETPEKTALIDDLKIVQVARPYLEKSAMKGPTMGLDTAEERQHASAMALQMLALGRDAGPIAKAQAQGYLMAIRDLAVDEGAMELAEQMERLLRDLK